MSSIEADELHALFSRSYDWRISFKQGILQKAEPLLPNAPLRSVASRIPRNIQELLSPQRIRNFGNQLSEHRRCRQGIGNEFVIAVYSTVR